MIERKPTVDQLKLAARVASWEQIQVIYQEEIEAECARKLGMVPERMQEILETQYPEQLNTDMTGHGALDIAKFAVNDLKAQLSSSIQEPTGPCPCSVYSGYCGCGIEGHHIKAKGGNES